MGNLGNLANFIEKLKLETPRINKKQKELTTSLTAMYYLTTTLFTQSKHVV